MTDHLTRHDAEDERDLTGREAVHEGYRDESATEVPGQDRTGDDQSLSTADLASAGRQDADDTTGTTDTTTPAESGGDVETPAASGGDVEPPPLIDEEKVTGFRDRWQNVQTGFVDDPKQAVRQADELVAAVISALATTFAEHKSELESQWQQGEPATEELRIALRRYRSFFDQLLPR
ncbi:hypothetical protein [Amycolatopsis sp. MtRt-6]|uniref:hypothetical protein n=1 Tax=Amycolatopsis sp. MtRt-6 TaxID=2792782 RepID=UPI001A8ED045|nr:hypothetical protein [Amycolatopsis sp. MtRt-6]